MMFVIDKQKCTGCGQCVDVCPAGAIMLQDSKAVIEQSLCRQCGICVDQCPVQAIFESISSAATQPEQEGYTQQQPGIFPQIVNSAGRLLKEIRQQVGTTGGRGRGKGGRGHFGRGRFRGRS